MTSTYVELPNRFTGIFASLGAVSREPFDPHFHAIGGVLARISPGSDALRVGGAGWSRDEAEMACIGEGIERFSALPLPSDSLVWGSFDKLSAQGFHALHPKQCVLFSELQYRVPEFPFVPFTPKHDCWWVRCRVWQSGEHLYVPADFVYLNLSDKHYTRLTPQFSTGLSAAGTIQQALTRGLQEVIERDALIGAWWSMYALEKFDAGVVWPLLKRIISVEDVVRPNLSFSFYRGCTPYSDNVTLVTIEGEDLRGPIFSIGSACRESLVLSLAKALLEALQGRLYIRGLLHEDKEARDRDVPRTFADHALYYTRHPEKVHETPLATAQMTSLPAHAHAATEGMENYAARLQTLGPIVWRVLTHPWISELAPHMVAVRVLVPGLQPLHGDHVFPHLGGKLWTKRERQDYAEILPHPFP